MCIHSLLFLKLFLSLFLCLSGSRYWKIRQIAAVGTCGERRGRRERWTGEGRPEEEDKKGR